jgi:hypothetical protein
VVAGIDLVSIKSFAASGPSLLLVSSICKGGASREVIPKAGAVTAVANGALAEGSLAVAEVSILNVTLLSGAFPFAFFVIRRPLPLSVIVSLGEEVALRVRRRNGKPGGSVILVRWRSNSPKSSGGVSTSGSAEVCTEVSGRAAAALAARRDDDGRVDDDASEGPSLGLIMAVEEFAGSTIPPLSPG